VEHHRKRAKTEQLFWGSILGSGGVERAGIGAEGAASHEPITYISV